MVNDEKASKANSKITKFVVDGTPRLGLIAIKNINYGEELRYDYVEGKLTCNNKCYYIQEASLAMNYSPLCFLGLDHFNLCED